LCSGELDQVYYSKQSVGGILRIKVIHLRITDSYVNAVWSSAKVGRTNTNGMRGGAAHS
jgi:hypothetical protein